MIVKTKFGNVKVCDYCKTVCCQSRFCSGFCARGFWEREKLKNKLAATKLKEAQCSDHP